MTAEALRMPLHEGVRPTPQTCPECEPLLALALLRLATAALAADPPQAAMHAQQAGQRFASLGDAIHLGQALRVLAAVRLAEADTPAHRALAAQAVALARKAGDASGLARAISTMYVGDADLARRVKRETGDLSTAGRCRAQPVRGLWPAGSAPSCLALDASLNRLARTGLDRCGAGEHLGSLRWSKTNWATSTRRGERSRSPSSRTRWSRPSAWRARCV